MRNEKRLARLAALTVKAIAENRAVIKADRPGLATTTRSICLLALTTRAAGLPAPTLHDARQAVLETCRKDKARKGYYVPIREGRGRHGRLWLLARRWRAGSGDITPLMILSREDRSLWDRFDSLLTVVEHLQGKKSPAVEGWRRALGLGEVAQ